MVSEAGWGGRTLRPYWVPVGAMLFGSRTRSREGQGPTGICVADGHVVDCPDNPPLATFEETRRSWGAGLNTGAGIGVAAGGGERFAELRAHLLWETGGRAGYLPLTLGVRF